MINEKNIERAKNIARTQKERPIVIVAQNLEFNRKILEWGKFDVLLSVERSSDIKADNLRQVDSGLNHVLAKIAAKNQVAIGIDLKNLRNLEGKRKALMLEKIIQNVRICRKAKCKIILSNYKDDKDAFAFMISIGADSKQAKESLKNK